MAAVRRALKANPIVALLGPRQCGKTTLARAIARDGAYGSGATARVDYFDLEDPADSRRLEAPMTALQSLAGLVVVDEVQRRPELFPVLRVLADRKPVRARFLLLGSASPALLQQTSESLAGRVRFIEMSGFSVNEVGPTELSRLWLRGGFPRAFLAASEAASFAWREDFARSFIERDLPQLGSRVASATLRRFWTMLAHYVGGIWNGSEIGNSLGEAHTTVRRHLDLLADALVVRVLPPWFENLGKRQVKAPKVYIRDTGLLHLFLGIGDRRSLERHPKLGASWESFVIEQLLIALPTREAYYWRTQAGAELDLLLLHKGRRIGVEIKYGDAPGLTKSMAIARTDLKLDRLLVVYTGEKRYPLADTVDVISLSAAFDELRAHA